MKTIFPLKTHKNYLKTSVYPGGSHRYACGLNKGKNEGVDRIHTWRSDEQTDIRNDMGRTDTLSTGFNVIDSQLLLHSLTGGARSMKFKNMKN